jgi:hypothetical protein
MNKMTTTTSEWTYQGQPFTDPGEYWGFVYKITCLPTGRKYLGRKVFTMGKSRQVKGKRKKYRAPSDWKTYWSSSSEVQADVERLGEDQFTREILHLCTTKSSIAYWETFLIFFHHALLDPDYYNQWVSCKIRKENLKSANLVFTIDHA